MKFYSPEFKAAMVQRMLEPNAISARALSEETGVSQATLSTWLRRAKETGNTAMSQRPQEKTPEEKLRLVLESASLQDEQLGEFLRREGVHTTHLEQWRSEMLVGLSPKRQSKQELRELRKENKQLKRELSRKETALAETAALLVLQKKVQTLWGDEDTST